MIPAFMAAASKNRKRWVATEFFVLVSACTAEENSTSLRSLLDQESAACA